MYGINMNIRYRNQKLDIEIKGKKGRKSGKRLIWKTAKQEGKISEKKIGGEWEKEENILLIFEENMPDLFFGAWI